MSGDGRGGICEYHLLFRIPRYRCVSSTLIVDFWLVVCVELFRLVDTFNAVPMEAIFRRRVRTVVSSRVVYKM